MKYSRHVQSFCGTRYKWYSHVGGGVFLLEEYNNLEIFLKFSWCQKPLWQWEVSGSCVLWSDQWEMRSRRDHSAPTIRHHPTTPRHSAQYSSTFYIFSCWYVTIIQFYFIIIDWDFKMLFVPIEIYYFRFYTGCPKKTPCRFSEDLESPFSWEHQWTMNASMFFASKFKTYCFVTTRGYDWLMFSPTQLLSYVAGYWWLGGSVSSSWWTNITTVLVTSWSCVNTHWWCWDTTLENNEQESRIKSWEHVCYEHRLYNTEHNTEPSRLFMYPSEFFKHHYHQSCTIQRIKEMFNN